MYLLGISQNQSDVIRDFDGSDYLNQKATDLTSIFLFFQPFLQPVSSHDLQQFTRLYHVGYSSLQRIAASASCTMAGITKNSSKNVRSFSFLGKCNFYNLIANIIHVLVENKYSD